MNGTLGSMDRPDGGREVQFHLFMENYVSNVSGEVWSADTWEECNDFAMTFQGICEEKGVSAGFTIEDYFANT